MPFCQPSLECPHSESNGDLGLRSPLFYPLNYEGKIWILNSEWILSFIFLKEKKNNDIIKKLRARGIEATRDYGIVESGVRVPSGPLSQGG